MYKERLNEIRVEKNISQNAIAEIMGISPYSYSHFETEDTIIPIKRLIFLSDYFNVSIDYIFGFTNTKYYLNSIKDYNKAKNIMRLKEFRKDNKLSQMELAKMLSMGNGTIANYERGSNLISTSFLFDICKRFEISADYLLGRIDNPKYFKRDC